MTGLMDGLRLVLDLQSILIILLGLVVGFTAGLLPGFSASSAAALALSFSLVLNTEDALIFMIALYAGDLFSGAVPAIVLGIPGTPGAAVTALDGYPLTQRGQGSLAIGVARMASTLGGVIGSLVVIVAIAPLSHLALLFGSREMFVVAILGLFIIGTVVGDEPLRGLVAGALGMVFATVGLDPVTSEPRLTFGQLGLYDGLPIVAVIVGVFALPQVIELANSRKGRVTGEGATPPAAGRRGIAALREATHGIRITLSRPGLILRSTGFGLVIGAVPGAGSAIAGFASYAIAKRRSKDPDSFGRGNPEGIIAAEAADHGVTAGVLVPTFTLGIPGSGTAAVMLAALYLHGVTPGPRVMVSNRPEVYAVLVGLLIASILILPLGILLATPMVRLASVRAAYLVGPVLMLSFIGAIALRGNYFDTGILLFFGAIGCLLRYCGYPTVPLILGLILGPLAESNFTRSLQLGQGELGYFFGSPTTLVLWAGVLAMLVLTVMKTVRPRRGPLSVEHGTEMLEHTTEEVR
jgi:putative tricarboxylic transport membrane protein